MIHFIEKNFIAFYNNRLFRYFVNIFQSNQIKSDLPQFYHNSTREKIVSFAAIFYLDYFI